MPRRMLQGSSLFGLKAFEAVGDRQIRQHGYSAGKIEIKDMEGAMTFWPRIAKPKQSGGLHIVPDSSFKMRSDQETAIMTFALNSRTERAKSAVRLGRTAIASHPPRSPDAPVPETPSPTSMQIAEARPNASARPDATDASKRPVSDIKTCRAEASQGEILRRQTAQPVRTAVNFYRTADVFLYLPTYIAEYRGIYDHIAPELEVSFLPSGPHSNDFLALQRMVEDDKHGKNVPIAICDPFHDL